MNNKIKEILEDWKIGIETGKDKHGIKVDGIGYRWKELNLLLDYITNLQQENERLKKQLEYLRTDEYLNQVKWERNFNETMNKELKTRIDKAVEYVKECYTQPPNIENFMHEGEMNYLLDILNGKE